MFTLLGLSVGCARAPVIVSQGRATLPYSIKEVPDDQPEFKREYTARVNDNVSLIIDRKWFLGSRFETGELRQTNGRWVLFDPKAPADKILDREILPVIEDLCRAILKADDAFRDSDPKEFTDNKGRVWRRVE